eukprot:scaffold165326_cov19-Tisochrysis_lutea.AAC.1
MHSSAACAPHLQPPFESQLHHMGPMATLHAAPACTPGAATAGAAPRARRMLTSAPHPQPRPGEWLLPQG